MTTTIVEVTNGPRNWGKFLVGQLDEEYCRLSVVDEGQPLLRATGWSPGQYLVLDLQTQEGAVFRPGGSVKADLAKHRIWVCPLFEPFLAWLYEAYTGIEARGGDFLRDLPAHVDLPDAPFAMHGYRRPGHE